MKRILIYRVVAKKGPFVSPYYFNKKDAQRHLDRLLKDEAAKMFFGTEYEIQTNELAM